MLTAHCGIAEEEVDRAVERVDDPAARRSCRATSSPSSPRSASSGRAAARRSRIRRSASRSASETRSVGVDFDATLRRSAAVEALAQQRARLAGDRLGERESLAAGGSRRHRRAVLGPAARLLELAAEREQPRLAVGRPDELHGEREAVAASSPRAPTPRAGPCGCRSPGTARTAARVEACAAPPQPSNRADSSGRRVNIGVSTRSTPSSKIALKRARVLRPRRAIALATAARRDQPARCARAPRAAREPLRCGRRSAPSSWMPRR